MEALKMVQKIISRLTEEEKGTVRTYLTVFNQRGKNSKGIKLFEILSTSPKHDDTKPVTREQLEIILYGKGNTDAFGRLLLRLKDKILEALIIDVNINRDGAYDEKSRVVVEVRKSITQAQILQSRGLLDVTEIMLDKVIADATKYELYEELLLAIRLMIDHQVAEQGDRNMSKLLKMYSRFDDAKNAVLRAEINRAQVGAELDYRSGLNAKIEWLKTMLDNMSEDYRKTSSSEVGQQYYYIEAQYYQLLNDHRNARKVLEDNLHLLLNRPGIYTRTLHGAVLLNLADNDLYLREFNRSYKTAFDSLAYFKDASFNHTQAIELMFYARYYQGAYQDAEDILVQVLPDMEKAPGVSYRLGRRLFLLACTLFMKKDYQSCFKLTHKLINPIEDDREGWNIGQRILSIMALIEMENLDEAATKIHALSEFMVTVNKNILTKRVKTIYALLQRLWSLGLDFKATYQKAKEQFDSLEEMDWQPRSPEMVIFQQWFFAKVSRQDFVQRIPAYPEKNHATRKRIVTLKQVEHDR